MIAIASAAIQAFLGKFWWQVPAFVALVVGVLSWDSNRINRRVEAGKQQVQTEIRKANDQAVETADRVRSKSSSSGVRAVPKNIDPHATSN